MSSVVQDTKNQNGLAQTFNNTFSATPTEGNLLLAFIFHDETMSDIADLTSSGWRRLGTAVGELSGTDYRISVWGKFAGASESTTVAWDIGEVNRRAHGYAVEYQDAPLTVLPAEDAAAVVTGINGVTAGTSNQVDDPIDIGNGQFGVAMVGTAGSSPTPPSWASEVTENEDWNINFRSTAIGFIDPSVTVQPTATWGSNRTNMQAVFALGAASVPLVLKGRSSFQATRE